MVGQLYTPDVTRGSNGEPCRLLDPNMVPRPATIHDQNTPIFMNPLLPPPHPLHPAPPAPPLPLPGHPVSAPGHSFIQPHALRDPLPASTAELRQQHPSHDTGSSDDDYALEFPSLEAFQSWLSDLEMRESVKFIKADTKSIPPHLNEYAKLVCAQRRKSVRDKYVGPFPGGFPNRKAEGGGCPAFIDYRTHYGTPVVRAKYFNQHSHPIGSENLSFTRHGRKLPDQERRMHRQAGFSRMNGMYTGTAYPAITQGAMLSRDREAPVRSPDSEPDALRLEPPPMASLKPPDDSPEYAATCVGGQQGESLTNFPQGRHSEAPSQGMPSGDSSQQTACIAPFVPDTYEQAYDNNLPYSHDVTYASPGSNDSNYAKAYSAASTPPSLSHNPDTRMHQPQPTHPPQPQAPSYQPQYLPTPTTPSSQIQGPRSYSYPYAYPTPSSLRRPQGETQTMRMPLNTHTSPISPVTPNVQPLPGPLNSQSSMPQCSLPAREAFSFNEDRWNQLETLFQAVRLRARSYVMPEPAISALESLLSQLYSESQHAYPRTGGGQSL